MDNKLTGEAEDQETNFLSYFSNCIFLEELGVSYNPLNITIADSFGNLAVSLSYIIAAHSQIKGQIPMGISALKNLTFIDFSGNSLTGNRRPTLGGLERLQRLFLVDNQIEGFIPEQLCQLKYLGE
jgi:LRR receptor-like serine/threonine-protein kinase FLS2